MAEDYQRAQDDLQMISGQRESLRLESNWKRDISGANQDWKLRQEEKILSLQQ